MLVNRIVLVIVLACVLVGCSGGGGLPEVINAGSITAMLERHNATRTAQGLDPLTMNATLSTIAQEHADYMAQKGRLSHTNDAGEEVDDRATNAGYVYTKIGENIGYDNAASDVYNAWLGSTGHYNNIVNTGYTEVGIGVAVSGIYQYWCVDFGHP